MSGRRVLIVDDDADMTAMLARHLEREDMAVVAATGGQAALDALASQEFDVVITDLVMDQVGGLEVLAAAGAVPAHAPRHPDDRVRHARDRDRGHASGRV